LYGASFIGWAVVLSTFELSIADPALPVTYIFIPLFLLHETVTRARWAGILMSRSRRASSLEPGCHNHGSMKVIILTGGLGAHLAEGTNYRAKPMVDTGGSPYIPVLRKNSITCR